MINVNKQIKQHEPEETRNVEACIGHRIIQIDPILNEMVNSTKTTAFTLHVKDKA